MHVSFVPYGERECVERLLKNMECQKHLMPMWKKKGKKIEHRGAWIPGQIRELPYGVKEYVFPKESLDMVLRTLNAKVSQNVGGYGIRFKGATMAFLRRMLKLKKIPKYDEKGELYLWTKNFVGLVVLGIREDAEIVGEYVDDLGWTHEAL